MTFSLEREATASLEREATAALEREAFSRATPARLKGSPSCRGLRS